METINVTQINKNKKYAKHSRLEDETGTHRPNAKPFIIILDDERHN